MMARLLLIAVVCLAACSKPAIPKDVLPPEKMQAVYWDYLKADIFANEFLRRDTSQKLEVQSAKLQAQVFLLHKVSKEQFYRSYNFYLDHSDIMKNMLDTMLVRQKAIMEAKNDTTENKKDSNGLFRRKVVDTAQ